MVARGCGAVSPPAPLDRAGAGARGPPVPPSCRGGRQRRAAVDERLDRLAVDLFVAATANRVARIALPQRRRARAALLPGPRVVPYRAPRHLGVAPGQSGPSLVLLPALV